MADLNAAQKMAGQGLASQVSDYFEGTGAEVPEAGGEPEEEDVPVGDSDWLDKLRYGEEPMAKGR